MTTRIDIQPGEPQAQAAPESDEPAFGSVEQRAESNRKDTIGPRSLLSTDRAAPFHDRSHISLQGTGQTEKSEAGPRAHFTPEPVELEALQSEILGLRAEVEAVERIISAVNLFPLTANLVPARGLKVNANTGRPFVDFDDEAETGLWGSDGAVQLETFHAIRSGIRKRWFATDGKTAGKTIIQGSVSGRNRTVLEAAGPNYLRSNGSSTTNWNSGHPPVPSRPDSHIPLPHSQVTHDDVAAGSTMAEDEFRGRTTDAFERVWDVSLKSFSKAWNPNDPIGLDPQTRMEMQRPGELFHGPIGFAINAIWGPFIAVGDTLIRGSNALLHAGAFGINQLAREFGLANGKYDKRLARDILGMAQMVSGSVGRAPAIAGQLRSPARDSRLATSTTTKKATKKVDNFEAFDRSKNSIQIEETARKLKNPFVDERKFSDYIFKPNAAHGKDHVFRSLGYSREDSAELVKIWQKQAIKKMAGGQYTLGKLNQYGQRINVEIALPGKGASAGKISYLNSGWMLLPDGSLKLNTPFSGFTR